MPLEFAGLITAANNYVVELERACVKLATEFKELQACADQMAEALREQISDYDVPADNAVIALAAFEKLKPPPKAKGSYEGDENGPIKYTEGKT